VTPTRDSVAAYVETHRDASHRAIARQLGVSASTVDRACRRMRQVTHRPSTHGEAVTHPADAPLAEVVQLRPRPPQTDAPADAGASADDAPAMVRPRCPCCQWRAMQPVQAGARAQCELCGFGFAAEAD
jgi:transposase-like protein